MTFNHRRRAEKSAAVCGEEHVPVERVREGGPGTPRLRRPGSAPIPLHTVIWFELWVTDVERAKAFHGELFGWTLRPMAEYHPDYRHVDAGQRPGTISAPWVSNP